MNAWQLLGGLLICAPFAVLLWVIVTQHGWPAAFAVFGGAAFFSAVITAGVKLLTGDWP